MKSAGGVLKNPADRIVFFFTLLFLLLPLFPGWSENLESLYKTDFSLEDDGFAVHRQNWRTENGRLHLSGKDPGGNFIIPYGENSSTGFDLKLGNSGSALSVTFLWDHATDTGHTIRIGPERLDEFSRVNGREVFNKTHKKACRPGSWHHVRADIEHRTLKLYIDNRLVLRTRLHSGFPDKGYLFFLAFDSDIWIDNIAILVPPEDVPEYSPVTRNATDRWRVRKITRPAQICSAPFDVVAAPNGEILVSGPERKRMVRVDTDGTVTQTGIPWGGNYFDISSDGRIWFYSFPEGRVSVTSRDGKQLESLFRIDPTHFPGSISVSEDGTELYLTAADDYCTRIFLYKNGVLRELAQEENDPDFGFVYSSIEVTVSGRVWVTGSRGVFTIENGKVVPFLELDHFHSLSSSSDDEGNLYVTAFLGNRQGIFRIQPDKTVTQVSGLPGGVQESTQIGMYVDSKRDRILAVSKQLHQVYSIRSGQIQPLLPGNFLSTPIAVLPLDSGRILVNGDELGIQSVDMDGSIEVLTSGLVCFQPPAAGMVFYGGYLYYTGGAPGFDSFIYTIAGDGSVLSRRPIVGIPAGIAAGPGGLYYADYENGTINRYGQDGETAIVVQGLSYPVGLCITPDGSMFVSVSDNEAKINPRLVPEAPRRRIMKIDSSGKIEEHYRFEHGEITFFDAGPNGTLYIPLGHSLFALGPDRSLTLIAEGFSWARDVKIAGEGVLYLTDTRASILYRIEKLK